MTKLLLDLNLGVNIKAIRNSREMTQEDVCTQLDLHGHLMSQSTYAQIETGRNIYLSDLITLQNCDESRCLLSLFHSIHTFCLPALPPILSYCK